MPGPVRDPGKIKGPTYIPNCVALRLLWTLSNGKQVSNILHASYTTQPTYSQAMVNSLWSVILGDWTSSALNTQQHSSTQFTGIGLRDMSQIPGSNPPQGYGEWKSSTAGGSGSEATQKPMPPNVAFVVSLGTGLSRQANRGRVYIPGFSSLVDTASGTITTAAAADAVAFVNAISGALSSSTPALTLCIAHPARQSYPSRVPGAPPIPARNAGTVPVTGISYRDLVWDTQRLRIRP